MENQKSKFGMDVIITIVVTVIVVILIITKASEVKNENKVPRNGQDVTTGK